MQSYQVILVAVDGSPIAERALKEAMTLAKEQQAQLLLVHVVDDLAFTRDMGFEHSQETIAYLHALGARALEDATKTAQDQGLKVEAKLLEIKNPSQRIGEIIAQEATAAKADLIVMGTHGRRGISRLFLGNVAETVVRIATPPVLLVRE